MAEMKTTVLVATKETRPHFGENSPAELMVHEITRGDVAAPIQKSTKTMQLSINNSTGAIEIFTIVIRITMPDGLG